MEEEVDGRAGRQAPTGPIRPKRRVDERDTLFARMARRQGTRPYDEYYARRPELKEGDDRLRAMAPLLEPGGLYYDRQICGEAEGYFRAIDGIVPDPKVVERWGRRLATPEDPSYILEEMTLSLGAVAVGCAPLEEAFVYTHKGRLDEDYGRPLSADLPSAVVFLVEMDHDQMRRAPRAEAIRESARQYYRAALIAKTVEAALSAAGYSARSHFDAHYELILPPLAVLAGLGELGRNNILVADRFGSRVRIGAVATDYGVEYCLPVDLGVGRFCEVCRKCAENCPSGALSTRGREEVLGVEKWPTDASRCYRFWRAVGTDCGMCMAVCPFSHRSGGIHDLVRWAVRRFSWCHRSAVALDDLFYGRRWKSAR
jgi:ferredoxin